MRKILGFIIWLVYRAWIATWRKTIYEPPELQLLFAEKKPVIFSMWHGNELAMISFSSDYKVASMTSQSKDGELMDSVLKRLGMKTSRGSSTRGGVSALKGMVRIAKEGYIPVIPVDGPKGPIYIPKPGVFELSRLLNAYIIPSGIACSSSIKFKKSWNKTFFPLPFSRVVLYWGQPIEPVTRDQDPRDPKLAQQLKTALDACGHRAGDFLA